MKLWSEEWSTNLASEQGDLRRLCKAGTLNWCGLSTGEVLEIIKSYFLGKGMNYGVISPKEDGNGERENNTRCRPTEGGVGRRGAFCCSLKGKDMNKENIRGLNHLGPQWVWCGACESRMVGSHAEGPAECPDLGLDRVRLRYAGGGGVLLSVHTAEGKALCCY